MASVFDYIFNIGGNFTAQISGMSAAAGSFSAQAEVAESRGRSLAGALATFSYVKDVAQNLADGMTQLSAAGVKLDSQMHDLSAVAGVTGEGLKQIEEFARESAKAFGTDASVAVEGYKLLLSQLSPELGKYPEALSAMGDCIQTTSKLMGGDGVAAAQVLTTAMNQYGVSLEDPTAAAGEMARMMNVMAAAGQAGSAELPAISAALQQCGMAAKGANVSFEETNAAIQVLDKAGKKASEGGVALRNVIKNISEFYTQNNFTENNSVVELIYKIANLQKFENAINTSYNYFETGIYSSLYQGENVVKQIFPTITSFTKLNEITNNTVVLNNLIVKTVEKLKGSVPPSFSTNLEISLDALPYSHRDYTNIHKQPIEKKLLKEVLYMNQDRDDFINSNKTSKQESQDFFKQETATISDDAYLTEFVENTVLNLFRREAGLCLN